MFKNTGVKNGIILGVVLIIFRHVCYMINPEWLMTGPFHLGFIIYIFFMYRSSVEERAYNDGFISFREALKPTFKTYVIGTLIGSIYIYFMYNFIDVSLNEVMNDLMGAKENLEELTEATKQQNFQMDFNRVMMNYLVGLIFPGFVLSLLVSALTKKERTQ